MGFLKTPHFKQRFGVIFQIVPHSSVEPNASFIGLKYNKTYLWRKCNINGRSRYEKDVNGDETLNNVTLIFDGGFTEKMT